MLIYKFPTKNSIFWNSLSNAKSAKMVQIEGSGPGAGGDDHCLWEFSLVWQKGTSLFSQILTKLEKNHHELKLRYFSEENERCWGFLQGGWGMNLARIAMDQTDMQVPWWWSKRWPWISIFPDAGVECSNSAWNFFFTNSCYTLQSIAMDSDEFNCLELFFSKLVYYLALKA